MYEERIRIAQEGGDLEGEAAGHCNLGVFFKDRGRTNEAITCMVRSLELDRRIGNDLRRCESLAALGSVYLVTGEVKQAIACYEEALGIMSGNEYHTQGAILGNLASCWKILGDRDRARTFYLDRIQLARRCEDQRGLALSLANWALFLSDDSPAEGLHACREAIEIGINEPRIHGNILNIYGVVLRRTGDFDGAAAAFKNALSVAQSIGDTVLRVGTLGHFGFLMAQRGDVLGATELFEEQRRIARDCGQKRQEAWALDQLSLQYAGRDLTRAIQYTESALAIRQEIQDEKATAELQRRLNEWRESAEQQG